jgi:hypothetical protein
MQLQRQEFVGGHARLELELSERVVGWLADEARGIERAFPPLVLSCPPTA